MNVSSPSGPGGRELHAGALGWNLRCASVNEHRVRTLRCSGGIRRKPERAAVQGGNVLLLSF